MCQVRTLAVLQDGMWLRRVAKSHHVASLAAGADGLSLEISCLVDIRDHVNRELALRFSSDIESRGRFFTDLNGFQVKGCQKLEPPFAPSGVQLERPPTCLPTVPAPQIQPRQYLKKLPLQANFYPMPVMAYIQDSQHRLTLHTAQALGVSSLSSGERDGMGHRSTQRPVWGESWKDEGCA